MFTNTDIYDGKGLLAFKGVVVIEGVSTLYPSSYASPPELCSYISIYSDIGLLALKGVVVVEMGGSTPYTSLYPSPPE